MVCNSQQILALCDLLEEPDFRQFADVDTPSGNFESRDVLSSSAVEAGMSAMNISDVSAISVLPNNPAALPDLTRVATATTAGYRCDVCGMLCKNSAGLQNHKV